MAHFFELVDIAQNNLTEQCINLSGTILIVSDIHGNYNALQLVLEFAKERKINTIVALGDYIDYNSQEIEVLTELLTNDKFKIILRGNHDLYINQYKRFESFLNQEIGSKIPVLPDQVVVQLDNGKKILLCHSTPDNNHFIYLDPQYTDLMQEYINKLSFDGFWYGHTHIYYYFKFRDKIVFNPGSLGDNRTEGNVISFGLYDNHTDTYSIYGIHYNNDNPLNIADKPFLINQYKV